MNHPSDKSPFEKKTWDYVILTASNEAQARAYRHHLDLRRKKGFPAGNTQYAVLPDPDGLRVGSGGATLNAIRYLYQQENGFEQIRALVIHSGGDSKRIPQYSALGKLFSPVPRMLEDGRRSTLYDELMLAMEDVPRRMAKAGVLVCSGDVLLSFNVLQIEGFSQDAAALSIKTSAETGANHGVYLKDEAGNVGRFLHKQKVKFLHESGAMDTQGQVDIDTGAVILNHRIIRDLHALISSDDKFSAFVNERARLSFYADFLYPLASGSIREQYFRETPEFDFTPELKACREKLWETLHQYRMKLLRLPQARFTHFGTTRELLQLMTVEMPRYRSLGWNGKTLTNSRETRFAASGALIAPEAIIGDDSYIEDSVILAGSRVGKGSIISGLTLSGQVIPPGAVLHGLKLRDGRFAVRMYAVDDDPKKSSLFGKPLPESLWTAPLFPICDTIEEALNETLKLFESEFEINKTGNERTSLMGSFQNADQQALLDWQDEVSDRVKLARLLQSIEGHLPLCEPIQSFHGISPRGEKMLLSEAEKCADDLKGFGKRIRIHYALTQLTEENKAGKYYQLLFSGISESIQRHNRNGGRHLKELSIKRDEVIVRLPLRVNFGGGWSDTPPYCMEHGGHVLNAAITIDGSFPAEAVIQKLDKRIVALASADSESYGEFSDITSLQNCSDPLDPFALHKAALIACGLIPQNSGKSLEQLLDRLGGGIFLSTQVKGVPRGSGLGTSSILSGACIRAIGEFTDTEMSDTELFGRVLCMEQLMSTGGGWQDQAGGLLPGTKMLSTEPGLEQIVRYEPVQMLPMAMNELRERFCLIYTGQRRLARNLLRDVVVRCLSGETAAVDTLYSMQQLAVLMRFELEKGSITNFAGLLSQHWELSKQLDAGCTNANIEEIFTAADELIDGKMICGAGGGGFLQVILKPGVSRGDLRARLREAQLNDLIDVWDCEFVF